MTFDFKRKAQFVAIALLTGLLFAGYLLIPNYLFSLDDRLRDMMFLLRGSIATSEQVVIVDIDEKSLRTHGRWPWSRHKVATLIDVIAQHDAAIIGLDIIFPEPDPTSPHLLAKQHAISGTQLEDYDAMLAQSLRAAHVIGGYLFLFEALEEPRKPKSAYTISETMASRSDLIPKAQSVLLNTQAIHEALPQSGFLNTIADEDGIIRKVPLLMQYREGLYLSMDMMLINALMENRYVNVYNSDAGVMGMLLQEAWIPTNRFGALSVNFRGPSRHFKYVSAVDILSGSVDAAALQHKIVLLGTSALGLGDTHATPFDTVMTGVEVHANVIDNILQGDLMAAPADDLFLNLLLIALSVVVSIVLFSTLSRRAMVPLFFVMLGVYYLFYRWLLFEQGVILNMLFVLLAYLFGVLCALLIDYLDEARAKEMAQASLAETNATMLEQSRSAAMGEMVGMIAHQWRQPLSSMSAISSKVKLKGQLGKLDSVEKDMDEVVDLTRYLSETIEDFRNFFKEDKSFEVTPLDVVVERSIRFTSHLLKVKDVTVTKNLQELSARLNANEITQVLVNLIKNAVDAYEIRGIKARSLHFEAEEHAGMVRLHVSDQAGGLEEPALSKIFEKSFSTKGAEGTGLGLYMCKKIIEENHQGRLHVSKRDGGLTFHIELPGAA